MSSIDGLDIGRQSNSSSSATDNQKRQETTSSTGAAAGSSGSLFSSIDFSSLYLVTGTAVLVAFYMSLYVFIFLAVRWPNRLKEPPLPPSSEDKMDQNQGEPVDDRSKWDRLKLFTYRAGRCLGLVNTILIFGCWCETLRIALSVKNNLNLSGTDGVGGGIICKRHSFLGGTDAVSNHVGFPVYTVLHFTGSDYRDGPPTALDSSGMLLSEQDPVLDTQSPFEERYQPTAC